MDYLSESFEKESAEIAACALGICDGSGLVTETYFDEEVVKDCLCVTSL